MLRSNETMETALRVLSAISYRNHPTESDVEALRFRLQFVHELVKSGGHRIQAAEICARPASLIVQRVYQLPEQLRRLRLSLFETSKRVTNLFLHSRERGRKKFVDLALRQRPQIPQGLVPAGLPFSFPRFQQVGRVRFFIAVDGFAMRDAQKQQIVK